MLVPRLSFGYTGRRDGTCEVLYYAEYEDDLICPKEQGMVVIPFFRSLTLSRKVGDDPIFGWFIPVSLKSPQTI